MHLTTLPISALHAQLHVFCTEFIDCLYPHLPPTHILQVKLKAPAFENWALSRDFYLHMSRKNIKYCKYIYIYGNSDSPLCILLYYLLNSILYCPVECIQNKRPYCNACLLAGGVNGAVAWHVWINFHFYSTFRAMWKFLSETWSPKIHTWLHVLLKMWKTRFVNYLLSRSGAA